MTKEELIRWAKAEKDKAVGKASTESAKKIQELKDKFYEDIGVDEFADQVVPIFEQAFAKYKEFYDKLDNIEKIRVTKYGYGRGYYDIEKLTNKNIIKTALIEAIHFREHPIQEQINAISGTVSKVSHTYDTVIQTLKNLPSAKDGLEYLEKLGFDTADIAPENKKKQLPATININVETKYLMIGKEKNNE